MVKAMLRKCIGKLGLCLLLLLLSTGLVSAADSGHPLEPIDLSSPRATLQSFLASGDDILTQVRGKHWDNPSRSTAVQLMELVSRAEQTLDLSKIPPAGRFERGRDSIFYLYDVLARIELPPREQIPSAEFYANAKDDKEKNNRTARWTIPNTEITIVRVEEGSHTGQFLFSPETVERAREFYEKTRELPYLRDISFKNFDKMRPYLSLGGWWISQRTIESFPQWLKFSILNQAVWKWVALITVLSMIVMVLVFVHRLSRRDISGHSVVTQIRRLGTPLALILLPQVTNLVNQQLTLTGILSENITLVNAIITYVALAWIFWTGSMVVAEAVITSPKIKDQSLDASLIRLAARTFSIVAVIAIIFYVCDQVGIPLYSLVAGISVGGIAIAFAAQNSIENFIGSLNLFADRPISVGDLCRYGEDAASDYKRIGTIESIGLRSTRLRGLDHTLTTIPNAEFSRMHIVNYDIRRRILLLTTLGLRYETTDDQLRFVLVALRDMLLAHPLVLDLEPQVRFAGFGDFSLNVEIRVDIKTAKMDEFRTIREDIYLRIMKIVKDSGTGFAFPSRTLYHSSDEGLDAELQKKAEAEVQTWRSKKELPFPNFSTDHRVSIRNTLDYPPEGSPEAAK